MELCYSRIRSYPFGMSMNSNYMPGDANKRLYNAGSEWQDEFSGIINYYSTFFREYDPVIGRFNGVDPKADATVSLSIYHYSGNNPVNFNDPMGDWFTDGNFGMIGGSGGRRSRHDWSSANAFFESAKAESSDAGMLLAQLRDLINSGSSINEISLANPNGDVTFADAAVYQFNDGDLIGFGLLNLNIQRRTNQGSSYIALLGLTILNAVNLQTSILTFSKTEGNGKLGHTAIRIGPFTYGYYPTGSVLGSEGIMIVQDIFQFFDSYRGEWVTEFQLNLSSKQINDLNSQIQNWVTNPGNYSIFGNHCTTVALKCLAGAGIYIYQNSVQMGPIPINPNQNMIPSDLNYLLKKPVNSNLVLSWSSYQIK